MSSGTGLLSWQQMEYFRREAQGKKPAGNLVTHFSLPPERDVTSLIDSLAELVLSEETLRIVEVSAENGGFVRYADAIALPVRYHAVASVAEASKIVSSELANEFARAGGPLWNINVFQDPSGNGAPTTVAAIFDHLVSDARSLYLFQHRLAGLDVRRTDVGSCYRNWVIWQRRSFPCNDRLDTNPARDFWRKHLDGTPADRPVELPFCLPRARSSGVVRTIRSELNLSDVKLRLAAQTFHVTPFVLILGSAAAAAAALSHSRDVTLKVVTHGRPAEFLDTLGWFSDCVPVRLRHQRLHKARAAMTAAAAVWWDVLDYGTTTPWAYILSHSDATPCGSGAYRPPQVLVNFIPYRSHNAPFPPELESDEPGDVSGLQLVIMPSGTDSYALECAFDPARFNSADVPEFADVFCRKLDELTADT
jgi:Condensation domain